MLNANSVNVLVVEDDADTRANLRDILELDDYRVDQAATVAEALDRGDWSAYLAILLDRKLPDGTAIDLLPRLKRLAPGAAVIIVTGYADVDGAIAAIRLGAADYLLKPIDPDELRARIGRIAEHRRAEELLRQQTTIFQSVLENMSDAALVVDRRGKVLVYNPAAERLIGPIRVGAPPDEWPARGRAYRPDGVTPYPTEDLPLMRALRGEAVHDAEVFFRSPGAAAGRWASVNAGPLRDAEGIRGAIAVYRDITERKQEQERALQAERLAAIGQMVTGLAHESRNALQRTQACLEMLALTVPDRPASLELIARIQAAQDQLHALYEDVRNFAAPIRLERRPCDLAELWREAWAHLEPSRQGRRVTLREERDGGTWPCAVDRFRLVQVFRNLLENALAACPDPVAIGVRCAACELEGRPAVRVSVRDNGPGLDPEQRATIFEPFYTTKTKGTGLGLAIARRIVAAHGGRIEAGAGAGPGAEFVITLPREGA